MSFIQPSFLVFFTLVLVLYWAIRARRAQNALLVVASAVFYGWVHPWFLLLLYGSATLDFTMGRCMAAWPRRKRWFLAASLAGNLGLLGWFKYFDFFVANLAAALQALGLQPGIAPLGIFLPVAISFYTFQTLGYSVDVYRGRVHPRHDYLDYLVFVSFFPQLVAGPVERASNLLGQVERQRRFSWEQLRSGLGLALWGGVKKMVVADTLAPYVDRIFTASGPSLPLVAAGALAFTIQILADFSGYTDIARGTARMLGFHLVENFRHPYLATHPSDFWRRWHISLSSWFQDYVYIPLGGNRRGAARTARNTWLTLLLAGIWHGAAWNFLIWGAYHAALLTLYRPIVPRIPPRLRRLPVGRGLAVVLMFMFTVLGFLIFREHDPQRLWLYLHLAPTGVPPEHWVSALSLLAVCGLVSLPLWLALAWQRYLAPRLTTSPWRVPLQTTAWALFVVAMMSFSHTSRMDFIYFQF